MLKHSSYIYELTSIRDFFIESYQQLEYLHINNFEVNLVHK